MPALDESASSARLSDTATLTTSKRLVIKSIDVDNFKSYAGAHTIGPFHKTFTAVIGPNGSGKSNVIDAMLFVFGKNAKKIRLEKLSELIHSSKAHPNLTRASVTVNFVELRESEEDKTNPTQRLEVPGSGFSVTREVLRNSTSQYYINGKRHTQADVVEMLIGYGIDLEHNRFLILQGEVEQIALMKPRAEKEGEEGLVEYFDDLIGSNQLLPRIRDATRVVEAYQEERLNALDNLRKVKGERDALTGAKETALSFIRKDIHLQRMVTVLCQLQLQIINSKLEGPRQRVAEKEAAIQALTAQMEAKAAAMGVQAEEDRALKKAMQELRGEESSLRKDKGRAEDELLRIKTAADQNDKQRKKDQDTLKKLKEDCGRMQLDIENAERDRGLAEQRLAEATADLARLEPLHEQRVEELSAIQRPLQQRLAKLKADIAPYDAAHVKAQQAVEDARDRLQGLIGRDQKATEDLRGATEVRAQRLQRLTSLQDALAQATSGSQDAEDRLSSLHEQLAKVIKLKYAINSQIDAAKKDYAADESSDRVTQLLTSQNIPKYYGNMRQLGQIAPEYDVAAGVAANCWDWHVVEDDETATKVLSVLKKEGLRCTMLVLERLEKARGGEMRAEFKAPAHSHRLFDLISPIKPRFAIAFYHAVRNTLVVKELDTARKVAFESRVRHRVVTLHGELIERHGGMSGGGPPPQGARLKATHAVADRAATRARLEQLQTELHDTVKQEAHLQEALADLNSNSAAMRPEQIRAARAEAEAVKASITDLDRRIRLLTENAKVAAADLGGRAAQEKALEDAERSLQAAEKARIKMASECADAEEQLANAGGPEFRKIVADLEAARQDKKKQEALMDEKKREQRTLSAKLDGTRRKADALQIAIEKRDAEVAEQTESKQLQATIAELDTKLRLLSANIHKVEGQLQDIQQSLAAAQRVVHGLENQRDDHVRAREEEVSAMRKEQELVVQVEERITACRERVLGYVNEFGTATLSTHQSSDANTTRQKRAREDDDDASESGSEADEGQPVKKEAGTEDAEDEEAPAPAAAAAPADVAASDEDSDVADEDDFDAESFQLRVPEEDLGSYDKARCEIVARELRDQCAHLRTTINFEAVAIWREKQREYREKKTHYDTIVSTVNKAEMDLEELTTKRKGLFMESFRIIQRKLKEMYQLLAQGGDADVDLVDASDPYEGIAFTVRPPKKSWKQISNLSGGEKTLSSLALVFALHHIRPTPVYVMDEIDAALDFRNVSVVGRYVLEQAQGAQFIIISLRNNMFELAHQLVGICKVNDVTRSLTINPSLMAARIERKLLALHKPRPSEEITAKGKRPRTGAEDDSQSQSQSQRTSRRR